MNWEITGLQVLPITSFYHTVQNIYNIESPKSSSVLKVQQSNNVSFDNNEQ